MDMNHSRGYRERKSLGISLFKIDCSSVCYMHIIERGCGPTLTGLSTLKDAVIRHGAYKSQCGFENEQKAELNS